MYAIIETGGKQYKVAPGEIVQIEKIEQEVGSTIVFDKVLLVADGERIRIGTPLLDDAKVNGEVVDQVKGDKITIIKFRRRKHYMRKQGHRQLYTMVKINTVEVE